MCADNSIVTQTKQTFVSDSEHLPDFKTLRVADPEQDGGRSTSPIRNTSLFLRLYAGTIRNRTPGQSESNPEHLLVLRLHAGMIHKSNPEYLLVFKAPPGDDPQVQSGTPPCF